MIDCECKSYKSIHKIVYEPDSCEAIVRCDDCGRLWYALLIERINFAGGDDTLEEYQIPITVEEYQKVRKTKYEDLSLNFLLGRKGRVIHKGGIFEAIEASFALGRCGKKRIKNMDRNTELTGLIKQLKQGNCYERQRALGQLAKINHKQATKAIAKVLNDPDTLMFMIAAKALGKIGDEIAIQALVKAMVTQDRYIDSAEPSEHVAEYIQGILQSMGKPVIPELIKALYNDAWIGNGRTGRWRAARTLEQMRDPSAVPGLTKALSEVGNDVRPSVAHALEKIGTLKALAALGSHRQQQSMLKQLRDNAQIIIQDMRQYGIELKYDRASIAWLDSHVEQNRDSYDKEKIAQLANTIGVFLGECLIRNYEGQWTYVEAEKRWGVDLGGQVGIAFPGTKAYKHLTNGPADSILAFFDMMRITK